MAKVLRVYDDDVSYMFYCPGCEQYHVYTTKNSNLCWKFNGDMEKPTFTPSLLTWKDAKDDISASRCHLVITDGKIAYCRDCTHKYAGQTIDMEPENPDRPLF